MCLDEPVFKKTFCKVIKQPSWSYAASAQGFWERFPWIFKSLCRALALAGSPLSLSSVPAPPGPPELCVCLITSCSWVAASWTTTTGLCVSSRDLGHWDTAPSACSGEADVLRALLRLFSALTGWFPHRATANGYVGLKRWLKNTWERLQDLKMSR